MPAQRYHLHHRQALRELVAVCRSLERAAADAKVIADDVLDVAASKTSAEDLRRWTVKRYGKEAFERQMDIHMQSI